VTGSPTVDPADAAALDRIEALLAANDLPSADVRSKTECFSVARVDGDVVAAGGLEVHGTAGLLRSLVVPEAERGNGYGAAMCDALAARAREEGVETLYLLTTTAAAFFEGRGYERVARETAPPAVRATTEFADLCPASAICMRRELG